MFPPIGVEELRHYEGQLGLTLPSEYRDFLLEYNGVDFADMPNFYVTENDEADDVARQLTGVFGFTHDRDAYLRNEKLTWPDRKPWNDLLDEQTGYQFRERVPDRFLAIAQVLLIPAEFVCLSTAGPDLGEVFYWSPGIPYEEAENEKTTKYLTRIAPSFSSWWNMMVDAPLAASQAEVDAWVAGGRPVPLL